MTVDRITLNHISVPLKGAFHTAQGGIDARDVVIVEVLSNGHSGWGEAAPYPGQDESVDDVIGAAGGDAIPATLLSAIDFAIADVSARRAGVSLAAVFGSSHDALPASIAIGLGGDSLGMVEDAVHQGVRRFKMKVAPGFVEHIALIPKVHPGLVIGLDANGAFDSETVGELGQLRGAPIAYFEQPCDPSDTSTLEAIRSLIDVPVFADESIRSFDDAEGVLASPLVDGVVVKPGRLGLRGSQRTIAHAEGLGKRWRASGLLETGIGRAYSNLFAARRSAFVSDVAPADWFLEHDIVETQVLGGVITLPDGPGLGVSPDSAVMERYLVQRVDGGDLIRRPEVQGLG